MPPPKAVRGGGDKFDLKRKIGPLPLWGWVLVVIAAYYLWKRYYGEPTAVEVAGAQDPYDIGFGGGGFFGDGYGGGGAGGGTNGYISPPEVVSEPVEELPATEDGGEIPIGGAPNNNKRRRHQIQRIKRKTGRRITALKRGGVTKAERGRIQQIKQRRKTRIKKIRARGRK